MEYKVLSIKWRPQKFEDVIGQKHVTQTLINSFSRNRIAQGYIFAGPRGVGKTTMARLMAMSLNADNGPSSSYDPNSTISLEIAGGRSIDVLEIDGASNRGIEEIRSLREQIKFAPMNCTYKVIIIDEVHMLTNQAFNALLRTLEEPPSHAKFIFCTTDVHKIPATIISRCQRFDFNRISSSDIVEHLGVVLKKENIVFDNESISLISRKADGSMRDALSLLDQVIAFCGEKIEYKSVMEALGLISSDLFFDFTKSIFDKNEEILVNTLAKFLEFGVPASEVLNGISQHVRNLMYAGLENGDSLLDLNQENKIKYVEEASRLNRMDLLRMGQLLSDVGRTIRQSHDPFLVLEMTAFKLIEMDSSISIEEILMRGKEESDLVSKKHNIKEVKKYPQRSIVEKPVNESLVPKEKKIDKTEEYAENISEMKIDKPENKKIVQPGYDKAKNNSLSENIVTEEKHVVKAVDNQERKLNFNKDININNDISFDLIYEMWPEIIQIINNEKPSLGAALEDYSPEELNGDILKINVNDKNNFNSKIAQKGKPFLEKKISDKVNQSIKIEFSKNPDGHKQILNKNKPLEAGLKNDKEVLDHVVDLFDGEILR
ncbi:MAG: hypothetical protein CMG04_10810 [Candidatus Marinimicrobia bacterium]|nr:hypothetical protein [Candidatus Neomarinimicrobiota bacterium]